MVLVDINDLSLIAKVKSDLLFTIGQLENENEVCSKTEAAGDLRKIVLDIYELEKGMSEIFFDVSGPTFPHISHGD